MGERLLVQPPEITEIDGPVIFLAGPIQGAPDWQTEAAGYIHDLDPGIVVASPRKDYPDGTFVYANQVDWETHHLRRAAKLGAIGFWLAVQAYETLGRPYAQTTRLELGEWMAHHTYMGVRLALGIEEGFSNARYIRRRFSQDCPDVVITDNLLDMCQNAAQLARQPR